MDKLDQILSELQAIRARLDEIKPVQGTRWKRQDMPEEWANMAAQLRPDLDAMEEYGKFQDHWEKATGKRAIKANWKTTWKNWLEKAYAPKAVKVDWRSNDNATMNKAAEMGIQARPGDSFDDVRRKIDERLR